MVNPFKDVNWRPDLVARRAFARSLMLGFPLVGLALVVIGWWRTGEAPWLIHQECVRQWLSRFPRLIHKFASAPQPTCVCE